MSIRYDKLFALSLLLLPIQAFATATTTPTQPKNIIFVIGDGMGFAQVEAAHIYNSNSNLVFENFPVHGQVKTHNALHEVTDSPAGGTALATGHKTSKNVLSLKIPGDHSPMDTILELAKREHKSTGVITTSLLTDATPAAFVAHTDDRKKTAEILNHFTHQTQPNIVFGGDEPYYRSEFKNAVPPYEIVTTLSQLHAVDAQIKAGKLPCSPLSCAHIYGGFGKHLLYGNYLGPLNAQPAEITGSSYFAEHDLPHLTDMVQTAVDLLGQNKDGFFLMVESGVIDHLAHQHTLFPHPAASEATRAIALEIMELDRTMTLLKNWVDKHPDTVLVLTADHETGGLTIEKEKTTCIGQSKCVATSHWISGQSEFGAYKMAPHTGADVPIYAYGKNAHLFSGFLDNTDVPRKLFVKPMP